MWFVVVAGTLLAGVVCVLGGRRYERKLMQSAPVAEPPVAVAQEPDPVAMVLQSAVDALEIGVVVGDANGRTVYRNEASMAWQGTHVQPLVEGHLRDAFDVAGSGRRFERTVSMHGPPRAHLHLLADSTPAGSVVATMTDVSAQARTDAMRTDFVANISHELKTPVGAIAVLAEALMGETDPGLIERVSERLVDEAHRAVRTIDDLLELAQIEAGETMTEAVDLASVVSEAVARSSQLADRTDVTVTAIEPPEPVWVEGDRRQLVSAMGNLVENAVKYSNPHGTVQVRMRVGARWVELMVADQGVGIAERDLDRVFERFYRVDRARSRRTGGTGLGLSIVRHVATNHGGDVQVSSQLGEGSTFVLRLPIHLTIDDVAGSGEADDSAGNREKSAGNLDKSVGEKGGA